MPGVSMPSISSPSAPQMPSMSSFPSISTETQNKNAAPQNSAQSQTAGTKTENTKPAASANAKTGVNSEAYMLSNFTSGLMGGSDMATLNALLGSNSAYANYGANGSNNSTNLLLQQVLEKIEKLETAQNTPVINQNGKIIRFWANGKNLLNATTDIYFSNKADDGSFFLTAQHKNQSGENANTETFYISVNQISSRRYLCEISLLQDFEDTSSPLYGLSQISPIETQVTGNLVSIKVSADNLKADILLDISGL